ncbi:serine hydrolase domain-containing protein [Flavihumibacter sp.]|uniref:serine hydrolase domain-containing protein n=1 Tax=Flavihumibacter sp. TaxID=1913981 RepID=UPI002FCB15E2|nr:beta-lactamase family protein [Flavihumibacter sediminis]
MKNRLFLMFLLLQCINSVAQNRITSKVKMRVDSLVNAEMKSQRIPGLSLIVVRDGKIDFVKGYGYSNLEHKVPVKPETIFQAGSVGKQFTAFAVMLLVQDGKISLDDKLTKFFPDAPSGWDSITVRNLLNHTSGFGDYTNNLNYRANYTEDSLYQEFKKRPLIFKVGEKQQYSNMGYATLGIIMSKVTGKFYGEFLKDRVFTPLGMTTARIITEEDIVPNRAAGYRLLKDSLKNQEWVSPTLNTTADGSMYVTALDMAKWEAALNAEKLLKKDYYNMMWAPTKLNDGTNENYGFGWSIDSVNDKRILEHNGSWQGFECTIKRYPEQKIAVVVFANLKRASTYKIATRVLRIYQPELSIASVKTISDTEPGVTKRVNEFIINVTEKKLRADQLATELAREIMDSTMQERGSDYFKSKGKFLKSELLSRKELGNDNREYRYRLLFSKEILGLMIQFNKENKIVDLQTSE